MLLIGQLAQATGLTRETLRFYEQSGLVRAQRLPNGYRVYPEEAVEIVRYIRLAQQLGFSLSEVGAKLPQLWEQADTTGAISAFLVEKVAEVDERIAQLQSLRAGLLSRIGSACPLQGA
jgi:MerR family transcriptional regulator, copper efflux regulator